MSAHRSAISARAHHTSKSYRIEPRDDDLESNAPPASIASFSAPTVIPADSVSQIGARSYHDRSHAGRASSHHSARHSSRSSHAQSNAEWDDGSSGLLTEKNLEAHNSEAQHRSATPQPPPEVYVEVYEERTATSAYNSHTDSASHSKHAGLSSAWSGHEARSHHSGTETASRAIPSHVSHSHASRHSHSHVSSPDAASTAGSRPPTVISLRERSKSPLRSSGSTTPSHTPSHSRARAPTAVPSHVASHASQRTSYRESSASGSPLAPSTSEGGLFTHRGLHSSTSLGHEDYPASTPSTGEVYEVSVYEEVPRPRSGLKKTYTVEVEAAEDQARERGYRIHHRHQYPVHGDS